MHHLNPYQESAVYLHKRLDGFTPDILLILGSGLNSIMDEMEAPVFIPYGEIPHFKESTAPGHVGRLAAGMLAGRNTLVMQGRFHIYEGYKPEEVAFPVWVANLLGAGRLILTCACGGVNTAYHPGDLVVLTDYMNFTHTGLFSGINQTEFEKRFMDMTYTFDRGYQKLIKETAYKLKIPLHAGVYYYMTGPQFETPAEIRAIRLMGGDLVGMSSVHEVIMARRLGMRVLGIGLVSNMAAGVLDKPITEGEVLQEGIRASAGLANLLREFVKEID